MNPHPISHITAILLILLIGITGVTLIERSLLAQVQTTANPRIAGSSTSLNAMVPPTPTNTLYEELQKRERELAEREKAQKARESYFNGRFEPTPGTIKFLYILIGGLFVLVLINFTFDIYKHHTNSPQTT